MMRQRQGFTLIELLVAIALLSIVTLLAYRGLDSVMRGAQRVEEDARHWRKVALFLDRFRFDIEQPVDRPVRVGELMEPAWLQLPIGTDGGGPELRFSRKPLTADQGIQRIGYRLRQQRIELLTWPLLDMAEPLPPQVHPLLDDVSAFDISYLGKDKTWQPLPLLVDSAWPAAVSVRLLMADGLEIKRVFLLP